MRSRSLVPSAWRPVLLTLALLVGIGVGARRWFQMLTVSVQEYHPALVGSDVAHYQRLDHRPTSGERDTSAASPPLAQQLVLVVMSGLRPDTARRLPALAGLAARGAHADLTLALPTGIGASWGGLLTGAGPELSGAPLLDPPLAPARPVTAETILMAAQRANLSTQVFGRGAWDAFLPGDLARTGLEPGGYSTAAAVDAATTEAVRNALRRSAVDVAVVAYSHVAIAGERFGATSMEYDRAAETVDAQLALLAREVDLGHNVLVVTADRGLRDTSRAAGFEATTITVPLVMVGAGIRPGEYRTIPQIDLAPTLAAILGVSPPLLAQGTTRSEMLVMSDSVRAQRGLADAMHQLSLATALIDRYGREGHRAKVVQEWAGLPIITSTMELGNDAGAWRLAEPTARVAAGLSAAVREQVLEMGAGQRLLPALLWMAVVLFFAAWRPSPRRFTVGLAAIAAYLLPLGNLATVLRMTGSLPPDGNVGGMVLLGGAVAGLAALICLWWKRDRRAVRLTVAGCLALASLTAGWLSGRAGWSLSEVATPGGFTPSLLGRVALALAFGGAVALMLAWLEDGPSAPEVARYAVGFCLALAALLSLQLAVTWWQVGATLNSFLPDLGLVFLQAVTLGQLAGLALCSLALPWLVAVVHLAATMQVNEIPSRTSDHLAATDA